MARNFTGEDRDRPVITAEGDRIGTVREVDEGRATVESTEEERGTLTAEVRDMLGWGDEETNERELRSDRVDTHDEGEIRLHAPPR